MSTPLSNAQLLARLGQLRHKALTAEGWAAELHRITDDGSVLTERVGGGRYGKSLRIDRHVLELEPVTRPADAVQKYVVKEA